MKIKKIVNITSKKLEWADVKKWYDTHLKPGIIDEEDSNVFSHVFDSNRFAGIFQFTNPQTQKFIHDFKPRSVMDLAQATAIYRPGPLSAKVDKLIINARNENIVKTYDHPIIDEILKPTMGYLIFQEQIMTLANKLAGMSLTDCDRLRKAILKRSVSGQSKNKSESEILEEKFIEGADKNGYSKDKAKKLYEDIAAFSAYAFNCSHSVAYAFCSYQTAWLMTYYEPEWLCAYVESMIGDDDTRQQAMSEIKFFGYSINQVDINKSSYNWTLSDDRKSFIPSFKTVKGIGEAAISEILENRPYKGIDDFLWNEDGSYRHSKANKRVIDALIKINAFWSMDLVGPGKVFENYKQMQYVMVENLDKLKKKTAKENFENLIKESALTEDWTKNEKINMLQEILGNVDNELLVPQEIKEKLARKNITPLDELTEGRDICWFLLSDYKPMKTKTGKDYHLLFATLASGKKVRIFAWGMVNDEKLTKNYVHIGDVEKTDFAYSLRNQKIKCVEDSD